MEIPPKTMTGLNPNEGQRIRSLDGLRGLAVILVLIWHFIPCQLQNEAGSWAPLVRRVLYLTGSGVDLFFVISGFLIAGILLDQKGASNLLRVFYLRRACRIFPLYFLLIGLFLLLKGTVDLPQDASQWLFGNPLPIGSYATFTQNIAMGIRGGFGAGFLAPTWSLAVEEQFYLVMPLLILCLKPRPLLWFLAGTLIALPILRLAPMGFHTYVNLPWRADPLLVGALLAWCMRSSRALEFFEDNRKPLGVFACILALGIPLMMIRPGILGVLGGTWIALGYGMIVYYSTSVKDFPAFRWLESRILVTAGTYSYGIYMFHQAVSGFLHGLILHQSPQISSLADALTTLLALVVTFGVAWVSFHAFEAPIIRLGRRHQFKSA